MSATATSKRDAPLGDAQPPHQRRLIFAVIGAVSVAGDDFVEQRVGAVFDEAGQERPFARPRRRVRNGLLPKIAASRRRPGAVALQARASAARSSSRLGQRLLPGRKAERETPRIGGQRQPVTIGGEVR